MTIPTMADIKLPKKCQFLFRPFRFKVLFGGRGSAKSTSVALSLLVRGLQDKHRILCTRQFQKSIQDSVHKLLSDLNDKYNLGYEVTQTTIKHPDTGTEFIFTGLHANVTAIKSLEGITLVFCEEAESITEASWNLLIPTIRAVNSEIIVVFNPADESDATYERFVTPFIDLLDDKGSYQDEHHYIQELNYTDNPFLPATMMIDIDKMKLNDFQKYLHIYMGHPLKDEDKSLIKSSWFDVCVDAHLKLNFESIGAKVIGYDPADSGADANAFCYRYGSIVQHIYCSNDGNLDSNCEKVFEYAIQSNVKDVIYDVCGLGVGARVMFDKIDPQKNITYTPFNASNKPSPGKYDSDQLNKDVFRNLRAEAYWNLRNRFYNTYQAVVNGKYCNPEDMISIDSECSYVKQLRSEITKIQTVSNPNGLIQIESKEAMKKRGISSPNIADSLNYTFAKLPTKNNVIDINIDFASEW